MPGVTLLPMIVGKQKGFPVACSEDDSSAGTLGSRGRRSAMTKGDVKLITYTEEGTDVPYDLAADPGEHEPLPERPAKPKSRAAQEKRMQAPKGLEEDLRSLGYLE